MKNILIVVGCIGLTLFSLSACGKEEVIQVTTNSETVSSTVMGKKALVEIGDYLWYDSATNIVYWWNGRLNIGDFDTAPSPYYAPNGLPYKYNSITNTFEEIPDFYS